MLKKLFFILLLLPFTLLAAQKECAVKPTYDIVIAPDHVQLINKENDLIISSKGDVALNGRSLPINQQLKKKAIQFQKDIRKQLPQFEQQAYQLLGDVKAAFDKAIETKLGDDSELYKHLNKLYKRLVKLLYRSVITENGETHFYYKNFNNIKKEGEEIGQGVFYNIVGDSIIKFNLFKNYNAIKKIAKDEWKAQKPKLKAFDANICQVVTNIDEQYQQILTELDK